MLLNNYCYYIYYYYYYITVGEVQKSLVIPNDPSFVKLIDLFSDNDENLRYIADFINSMLSLCYRMNADSLKVKKLILILQ